MAGQGHDTLIAKGVTVQGTVQAQGVLRVDGRVDGKIASEGDVVVGQDGVVHAEVSAKNVVIAGQLHGNVTVTGRLHILAGGALFGDVKVGVLIVEEGAVFKGQCEMEVRRPGEEPVRILRKVDSGDGGETGRGAQAQQGAGS